MREVEARTRGRSKLKCGFSWPAKFRLDYAAKLSGSGAANGCYFRTMLRLDVWTAFFFDRVNYIGYMKRSLMTLWSGLAASVPLVLFATIAIEAIPHARGIGFPLALRYAVVAPVCILIAVIAAFVRRALKHPGGGQAPSPVRRWLRAAVAVLVTIEIA